MAEFTVNSQRFDPYPNFKFRVKWEGRYVAGISKVSALKRITEVVKHREGGDPSTSRKSPGRTEFEPITLERGVTHDTDFENWASKVWHVGARTWRRSLTQGFSQGHHHRFLQRGEVNWPSATRSIAAGSRSIKHCRTWTPTPTRSRSNTSSSKTKAGNATPASPSPRSRAFRSRNPMRTLKGALLLETWDCAAGAVRWLVRFLCSPRHAPAVPPPHGWT